MNPQDRTHAILHSELTCKSKLFAVMIASCRDDDVPVVLSWAELSRFTGLGAAAMRRITFDAESAGWMEVQRELGYPHRFRVVFSKLPARA